MGLKQLYKITIQKSERLPVFLECKKIYLAEWYAVLKKSSMYKDIRWTKEQKAEFNKFWKENYGKKISSRWHKLYQSINGIYNIKYIPEIIYTSKLEPRGNEYIFAKALADKALIRLFTMGTSVKAPRTIVSCSDGILVDEGYHLLSVSEAERLILSEKEIVIKPTIGECSGNGVEVLKVNESFKLSIYELKNKYKNNFIIQEVIKPNDQFRELHPKSINTVRVISYIVNGCIKTAPIAARIGVGTANVDNIHAGGLAIFVSNEGRLSKYAYQLGFCDRKNRYEKHLDTGVVFEDYYLPFIPEIIENAKNMHMKMPHLRYISWDFTVDKDDNIILIEANLLRQGIWFPQIVSGKGFFDDDYLESILKENFQRHRICKS